VSTECKIDEDFLVLLQRYFTEKTEASFRESKDEDEGKLYSMLVRQWRKEHVS
jgi:hypothetical protein